jgi:hypothetical protein
MYRIFLPVSGKTIRQTMQVGVRIQALERSELAISARIAAKKSRKFRWKTTRDVDTGSTGTTKWPTLVGPADSAG